MLGPAPDNKQQNANYAADQPAPSWLVIRDTQGAVVAEMARGTNLELARQFAAGPDLLEAARKALIVLQRCCRAGLEADTDIICDGDCDSCDIQASQDLLYAAIAKATGGTQGERNAD